MKRPSSFSLAELAEVSGVPARTVRYYIARGLLEGPQKGGRDAAYGERHLRRLARIQELQSSGRTLAEIAMELAGATKTATPAPSAWWRYEVAPDVAVMVKADGSPWRVKRIKAAVAELAARLGEKEGGEDDEQSGE